MTPSPGGTEAIVEAALSAAVFSVLLTLYRAVLLMTKRDLADLCLEGLLESTEQQQQAQLAALLQVRLLLSCALLCLCTLSLSACRLCGVRSLGRM